MESSKQVMEYKILPYSFPVGKSSQTELALILIITSPTHPGK